MSSEEFHRDFKAAFKFFKAAKPPVLKSLAESDAGLADPRKSDMEQDGSGAFWKFRSHAADGSISNEDLEEVGLKPLQEWSVREVAGSPGSIVIANPFTDEGQLKWIRCCLLNFPRMPENLSNLDPDWKHVSTRADIDWFSSQEHSSSEAKADVPSKRKAISGHEHVKKAKGYCKSWLEETPIWKLRWITLGYHHDWDTKMYSEEKRTPFPADVDRLCQVLATGLGFADFKAQAAIINYYHMDSTLSIHQDISEPYKDAPLFSISFGQPGIFLIGPKREEWPSAVLLRSGDVFVMSGESRLDFHAVPKIFREFPDDALHAAASLEPDVVEEYLSVSRINMNIRQVLRPGKTMLYEE